MLVGRGLDADVLAFSVYVTPGFLSCHGEDVVRSAGLQTFELMNGRLERRDEYHVAGRLADDLFVLVEHKCGVEIPLRWKRKVPPIKRPTYTEEPGF